MSRLNFTILIMHDYMESGVLYLHLALDSTHRCATHFYELRTSGLGFQIIRKLKRAASYSCVM